MRGWRICVIFGNGWSYIKTHDLRPPGGMSEKVRATPQKRKGAKGGRGGGKRRAAPEDGDTPG